MPTLAVVGNVVADVLVHPLDRWPARGLAAPADSIALLPGGCAFHTAATARRLGLAVELFGALGADAPGDVVRAALAERDLLGPAIQRKRSPTTITVVIAASDGERSFLITEGAAARFSVDSAVERRLRRARHVHLAGFSLLPAVMGRAGARLLQDLRRRGITTSLDIAWKDGVDWRRALDPLLPHLTAMMPSAEEATAATGCRTAAQAARWLRARGVEHVLITQGARGAFLSDGQGELSWPAYPVRVVDTTGAGDSFAAGWLAAFLEPRLLPHTDPRTGRLAFASACGALACTGLSGEAGPRDAAQVRRLISASGARGSKPRRSRPSS